MPILEVLDLSRWYGEVIGLSGASFSLEPGVTGLLGTNGAGKSTLLKVLSGVHPASTWTGELRIDGEAVRFADIHAAEQPAAGAGRMASTRCSSASCSRPPMPAATSGCPS